MSNVEYTQKEKHFDKSDKINLDMLDNPNYPHFKGEIKIILTNTIEGEKEKRELVAIIDFQNKTIQTEFIRSQG